jgi:hypothetical protein
MIKEYFYLEHKDNTQYRVICSKGKTTNISEAKARRFAQLQGLGQLAGGYFTEQGTPFDFDKYKVYNVPKYTRPLFDKYSIIDTIIKIDNGDLLNSQDYPLIKKHKKLLINLHKIREVMP